RGADCARDLDRPGRELAPDAPPAPGTERAVAYYAEHGRAVGVWLGAGAAALGLAGPIRGDGVRTLERLLAGRLPDGTALARPVWRPDPAGRLPGGPLLAAVAAAAAGRGIRVDQLLGTDAARAAHAGAVGALAADPR